jgi:SNF2 family DNA or RNA helicase
MKYDPHPYQAYALDRIIQEPNYALFLEMGLGKTVVALTAVDLLLYDYFKITKVLVIAPKRVAEDTWTREASKWDHLKHLKISKILGSPAKKREKALKKEADVYIINRENVTWLVKHLGKKWDFDMVIIDELSSFKSPKSQRFRNLRKVRPKIKRLVGLTGTPTPNGLVDLWSQVYLLDRGQRLGKTLTEYRNRYLMPEKFDPRRGIVFKWGLQPGAEEKIYRQIDDIACSMKTKDWLDLPERIDVKVPVVFPKTLKNRYLDFEREKVLEIEEEENITAANAATLTGKLQQFAQGAIYNEDKTWNEIHSVKLDALEDLIEEANGKPVLVFYWYKHDKERILNRIKNAKVLEGPKDIEAWNTGEVEVMLAHPGSAGHGLNLQDGGNAIIWYALTWSLEYYQQANARLHRQGQTKNVIIHHLIAEGTIDEDIMSAIEGKADGQNALMEAVKARIRRHK